MFSVLEIEKLNFSSLFGIYLHCKPGLFSSQVSDIGPSWSACVCVCVGGGGGGVPFPKRQILDSSKLKDLTDNNFKFDENDSKSIQMGRKTLWGKRGIARYEQFLLFPQCFQKTTNADT